MKTNSLRAGALALALCVIALVACAAPPPTATPVPPTSAPTAPPTVGSEVQASKSEDVFGIWLVVYSPSDRFASAENHWEHTANGDRIATFISGAMKGYTTTAKYWFEGGLYKIQYPTSTGEANSTAIGTYQVYVTKQDGKAVQLRFVVVDDSYTARVDRMTFRAWTRVEQ